MRPPTPLIPAKAGTQSFRVIQRGIISLQTVATHRSQNWVPAFAGMSGF